MFDYLCDLSMATRLSPYSLVQFFWSVPRRRF